MREQGRTETAGTSRPAEFATLLRHYRLAAELTQEDLAARSGLSVRGISDLERGLRAGPQEETVRRLAEAMQLASADRERLIAAAHRGRVRHPRQGRIHTRNGGRPPLVGRADELSLLEAHLLGEGPPLLLVAGEPGMGKSRLLQELPQRSAAWGLTLLTGGASRRSGQEPYSPYPEILARFLSELSAEQRTRALRGCEWLATLVPEQVRVTPAPAPVSLGQERRLVFAAVSRFLRNVAGRRGTLLVVDDLQWAGAAALDLLVSVVVEGSGGPLRVVGAYRDVELGGIHPLGGALTELGERALARLIHLSPLSDAEAAALLDELLPEDTEEARREAILERTGGIPFFIVSCALDPDLRPDHVPWNLAQSIRHRLDAIPPSVREMLDAAAVIGRVVPQSVLFAVLDQPAERVFLDLDEAWRARLLVPQGEREYRFAHDLVREVVEADLGAGRRRLLHRRIAETLALRTEGAHSRREAAEIAWHFARGDDPERALPWTLEAGKQSADAFAWDEAEAHYRVAVAQARGADKPAQEAEALWHLGHALRAMGRCEEALQSLESAVSPYRSTGDADAEAAVLAEIGFTYKDRGMLEEGLERVRYALPYLQQHASPQSLAELYHCVADLYLLTARPRDLEEQVERWLVLARQIGDQGMVADAETKRAVALITAGRAEEALRSFRHAVELAQRSPNAATRFDTMTNLAWALLSTGCIEEALEHARGALRLAEEAQEPGPLTRGLKTVAEALIFIGDWAQARALLERALCLAEPGASIYAISPRRVLGQLCLWAGDWDRTRELLQMSLELAEEAREPFAIHAAQGFLALLDLRQGKPAEAFERVRPLLPALESDHEEHDLALFLSVAPEAQLAQGNHSVAEDLVGRIAARNRARGQRLALVHSLRVQGMVYARRERWEEAIQLYEESASLAREMRYRYAEAQALHQLGMVPMPATRAGRESIQRQALSIFRRLGAHKDAEEAERALKQ